MRKPSRIAGRAAILTLFAALAAAAPAVAQDVVEPLEEQIRMSRQRLVEIREEQRRLKTEMNALSTQVHDVSAEIQNLNDQTRNQQVLLRELDNQLAIGDQLVLESVSDLLRTKDQLVEKEVLFARRARDLYKRGPLANVQVLLSAQSFSDLINRYQYLYLVALHDRMLVGQITELQTLLVEQYDRLRQEANGLRDIRNEKVREIQDLYYLEQERGRRLSAVRCMQSSAERRLEELERGENELTGLVDRLEREREAAEALAASAPTRGTLTEAEIGKLDWPVEGRVIYTFGRQRNDDGTVILRNGIGIAAAEGTPVKAVAGGTVVFAQPYLSYGPSVILSHGGGNYSVYLYLSAIVVEQGEAVILGQTVGNVGGADTPEGTHLEFQIRSNRNAVDPMPWLRR
jgi:septal ring factor EnvC (AmiA/AmiB activator)